MRYVQVNSVPSGSTGGIMLKLHRELLEQWEQSYVCWGRGRAAESDCEFNFGTKAGLYCDVAQTRLDGRAGFHSKAATRRLLARLDEIDPDVVHLHNLHGYYVNIEMLFDWLAVRVQTDPAFRVVWTLHDCWVFTGHCAYFTYVKCAQWKTHCAYEEPCCQTSTYPKTFSKTSCARNYDDKRRLFTMLPADRMTIVTPSQWLADLVGQSFLAKYPVEVRHNTIDTSAFKPTPSDFRERYGIGDRFMVLGVASPWTERKGLGDFVRLARELDSERFAVVLVGLNERQIKQVTCEVGVAGVPDASDAVGAPRVTDCKLVALPRTGSARELAEIYTAADVFFNPTREDNFPTVNLEAEACGTPVITYDTGGCRETISSSKSQLVADYKEALMLMKAVGGGDSTC